MQVFHQIQSLRQALAQDRAKGLRIGFVPTMGNLHAAHLALVQQAQQDCDKVVTSIFVNPLQFGLNEDWDKYPRTLVADTEKLESVGCDYLFCPDEKEIYPNGMAEQTRVIVPSMTDVLCGASRPGHFEGVTTVVAKLFNIVQPDEAVFGAKDFQQLAVIRRMVEDLCLPIEIRAGEIVREADGLALSSRNQYLSAAEREQAAFLYQLLCGTAERLQQGEAVAELEKSGLEALAAEGFEPEYLAIRRAEDLAEIRESGGEECVILVAARLGKARLIDNLRVPSHSLGH